MRSPKTTLLLVSLISSATNGFVTPLRFGSVGTKTASPPRLSSSSSSSSSTQPEVAKMRIAEMKSELQSYGISTKSFLEKSELVDALTKARDEGLLPKQQQQKASSSTASSSSTAPNSSPDDAAASDTTPTTSTVSEDRSERIGAVLESINSSMKARDMKKELESLGVSTKSFFEKGEFARALAEARVDGVTKTSGGGGGGSSGGNSEGFASYDDVEVLAADGPGPRPKGSETGQQGGQQQGGSPFGGGGGGGGGNPFGGAAGGGNPFGGAAGGGNPFGGGGGAAGGMGGIADMLKNMGGMGGGGAPGGMGGMADMLKNMGGMGGMGGMGDMGAKAQQMMSNPKVMEIISKAQGNPKMMKIMQECMANPAAMAKYQNDPEVAELINEMKKFM